MSTSSALVLILPEAEAVVGPYRARHDPAAAAGAPAHVTLLFPFMPPHRLDAETLERLTHLFAAQAPFDIALARLARFPGVLYLAPEPAERLRTLTGAIWHAFPRYPPYRARHRDVVPHLCIGQSDSEAGLDRLEEEARARIGPHLPIRARARAVSLLTDRDGRWAERARFALSGQCGRS